MLFFPVLSELPVTTSPPPAGFGDNNPLLEAGKIVHESLLSVEWEECVICKERWFDMDLGPNSKKCRRCAQERTLPGIPKTFSEENDMDPGEQPDCLRSLNSVEVAAISRICPVLSIYKLKGGATALKGHSISFEQDVQEFAKRLPRRPQELPMIIIKAPNQSIPLHANRIHMLRALSWLIANNPFYSNIEIDFEAANLYPDNSSDFLSTVRHIDTGMAFVPNNEDEAQDEDEDEDIVETTVPMQVPAESLNDQITAAVLQLDRNNSNVVQWPKRNERPISEFTEGYYSMAHPNLFCHGKADITVPRIGKKPEFLAYIRHLLRCPDRRFAKDPRFVLNAVNMYRRHKGLTLANVYAKNVCKDMTMAEVKEKVAAGDETLMKSLLYFGSQIPGTKQYFRIQANKALSMERWIRIQSENEEMINLFLTFSLPDLHMPELHRLFPNSADYLGKIVIPSLSDIPADADPFLYITEKADYHLRSRNINDNGHIVDWLGNKRLELLMKHVLKDVLGVLDWIVRSEYQGRKALHWHIAARMKGLSLTDIRKAFKVYGFDVRSSEDSFSQEEENQEENYEDVSPEEQALILESRQKVVEFAVNHLGLSSVHPQENPKQWPGPEGQNVSKPLTNCLRKNYLDVITSEGGVLEDYENLVNRVQLHGCRLSYCLKIILLNIARCRFGYPMRLNGFEERMTGADGQQFLDELLRVIDFETGGCFEFGKLTLLRNHARLVMHVPELLIIWRGNIDAKLIESVEQTLKYILKYMMKPEVGSLAFSDIVKQLTEKASEDCQVRKLFQSVLLKTVSEHDISKNECFKIISAEPYVKFSRPFRMLNLTGTRRLNLEQAGPAMDTNFCDLFWARKSDPNFLILVEMFESGLLDSDENPNNISLYKFTNSYTLNSQLQVCSNPRK